MSRGKYTPEFKAKIVLEVLQGERELGAIAAENNLNPNMVRNWKAEFVENASSIFEEHGKAELSVRRQCELLGISHSSLDVSVEPIRER